jgi:hypothetical protein
MHGCDLTSHPYPDRKFTGSPQFLPGFAPVLKRLPTAFQQRMKVKPEQIERVASQILAVYRQQGLIATKADDAALKAKIVEVLGKNFAEEEAIEEEARKMLATHGAGARDLDPYKMFLLAKQKLAAKRGFIL